MNAVKGNFQLSAGSPAVDGGAVLSPYTDGFSGVAPDIGAYEYGLAAFSAGQAAPAVVTVPPPQGNSYASYFAPKSLNASRYVANSGDGISFTRPGAWARFSAIDFGAGVTQLVAQVSLLPVKAARLQIRMDGLLGPVAGTLMLPAGPTPASVIAQTLTAALSGASGVHDLYLILLDPAGGAELEGFTFLPLLFAHPTQIGETGPIFAG